MDGPVRFTFSDAFLATLESTPTVSSLPRFSASGFLIHYYSPVSTSSLLSLFSLRRILRPPLRRSIRKGSHGWLGEWKAVFLGGFLREGSSVRTLTAYLALCSGICQRLSRNTRGHLLCCTVYLRSRRKLCMGSEDDESESSAWLSFPLSVSTQNTRSTTTPPPKKEAPTDRPTGRPFPPLALQASLPPPLPLSLPLRQSKSLPPLFLFPLSPSVLPDCAPLLKARGGGGKK